jgi:tyrosyl-tRNA synthetase
MTNTPLNPPEAFKAELIDNEINELSENVAIITPEKGLAEKIRLARAEKRPLIVKLGIDPTSPDIHLGHTVILRKLRQFQKWGHKVIIIVGDVTTMVGDPTGRNKTRPQLSFDQIRANATTYLEQLGKVLDSSQLEVRWNSEWLAPMNFEQVLRLLAQCTVAQILTRQEFHSRLEQGIPIQMHEIIYPLLQGQDSLAIASDIEMGGTDQLFNCMIGRHLQEIQGKPAQVVVSMPLLVGLDGKEKMSKSLGNTISVLDPANEMFGKAMSIPDTTMPSFIRLLANFETPEIKAKLLADLEHNLIHPMLAKKLFAQDLVEQFWNKQEALLARQFFENQFQAKDDALKEFENRSFEEVFEQKDSLSLIDLVFSLTPENSRSQIRRLIEAGAVSVDQQKVVNPHSLISRKEQPITIQIGKRGFFKIC